jgi:hypothetical protein
MTGFIGPIVNVTPLEVSPLYTTAKIAVPGDAIKAAGTDAVNWAVLTNVVPSADPFH